MKTFVFWACMFVVGLISCFNDVLIGQKSLQQAHPVLTENEMIENLNQSFNSVEGTVYPDNYGGMYIDKNGRLIILVTDTLTSEVKRSYSARARSNNFLMKSCEYSYNELDELKNELETFFLDKSNWDFMDEIGWTSIGISYSENRVTIIMDCTNEKIEKFKNQVSSSPMIKFEQSKGKPNTATCL